jgi:malonate transporter
LALGYGAGKLGIVDNRQVDRLNALVMNFALPASLFAATASASREQMIAQVPLFAILGAVMLLIYFAWYVAVRSAFGTSSAEAALQALTIAFPNFAGVGLPILAVVIGPTGTVPLAVALAAGSLLVSPLTLIVVELGDDRTGKRRESPLMRILKVVQHAVTKPVVAAPALGILLSLLGLKPDGVIDACLGLIAHAAAGVALFLTGLILSAQSFRLDWKVVGATGVADIVRPLLTALVVFSLPVPGDVARTIILLAAVPSGFFGILFALNYRLSPATTGSMIIASTGFSIVTMAVAIALLFPH